MSDSKKFVLDEAWPIPACAYKAVSDLMGPIESSPELTMENGAKIVFWRSRDHGGLRGMSVQPSKPLMWFRDEESPDA